MAKKDVLVAMGSQSDWQTMKACVELLDEFDIDNEARIISAHRTPERLVEVAKDIEQKFRLIIAGAGGAAHLPGMLAAFCRATPVLGVPMQSKALSGVDSLYSIVQMPFGVPVATFAIGEAGAKNAAIFAAQMLAMDDAYDRGLVTEWRQERSNEVDLIPHNQESK